jgi:hypothetical protein
VDREQIEPKGGWDVRDHQGWRSAVLSTASADVLVAWHAATLCLTRRTLAGVDRRYGTLIHHLRQARLAGDLDHVAVICHALLDAARTARPPEPLASAWTQLAEDLHAIGTQ